MAFTEEDRQKMDMAAADAEAALAELNVPDEALQKVANWWKQWYPSAGHKRLARILLQYAKKEE